MKFHLFEDMVKIANQILGKSNMFGYKTTTADQLYLWYCFMGKIYTIHELHWHTRLLWLYFQFSSITIAPYIAILYFMYGTGEGVLYLLYVLFLLFIMIHSNIVVPLLAFVYRRRIECAIELVDKIESKNSQTVDKVDNQMNTNSIMINAIFAFWLPLFPFVCACYFDVIFFYDESKPKNYEYYVTPLPNLEHYGSLTFYLIYNMIVYSIAGPAIFVLYTAMILLPTITATVCYNEVRRIVHRLNSLSQEATTLESYQVVELRFKQTLVECLLDYRRVISVVQHIRGNYETLASITLPLVLIIEIVHANLFLSPEHPLMVKIREMSAFIATILPVFYFCWIGELLDEMASTMSFAVYSTPWYWSTRMRKDVYLFLCETQQSPNATAWGVYPLLMRTFLRFMNTIQSSVNVLRATTANR